MSLIARCIALARAMPDPDAHKRYLATLSTQELEARINALQDSNHKASAPVRFWQVKPQPAPELPHFAVQ